MIEKCLDSLSLRARVLALSVGAMLIGVIGMTVFLRRGTHALVMQKSTIDESIAAADALTWQLLFGGGVGVAVVALALSWLLSSVQRRLDRAVSEIDTLRSRDSSPEGHLTPKRGDQTDTILDAISRLGSEIHDALGDDHVEWDELGRERRRSSRLKACIEGLPTNIMTIDRDFNLIYMNPASKEALRRLQAFLPVQVDQLIGTCIDVFHADPSTQRQILADPSNLPHTTRIQLGPETLELTATAAFDEKGEYIGATAAWDVLTAEEKSQEDAQMLAEVLSSVADGALPEEISADVAEDLLPMRDRLNALIASMKSIAGTTRSLGDGDFTIDIAIRSEQDALSIALNAMVSSLGGVLTEIRTASAEVASGTVQVSSTGQTLSDNASQSAASLEEISSTMEEMAGQTRQNAENASQAVSLATAARASAEGGDEQMKTMVAAMREIDESSQDISKIIKVIDEIAFQTNLLALNAAVEAARAGVHGKGFAVVAEEVRNLAERSAQAAKETTELIEGSGKKVAQGRSIAEKTAESLVQIVDSIGKATDLVSEIAAASQEQAEGISQVNIGLTQVDRVTQQNTASAEELAAAADTLRSRAGEVQANLARFNLPGGPNTPAQGSGAPLDQGIALPQARVASTEGWDGIEKQVQRLRTEGEGRSDPGVTIALDDDEFGRY